VENHDKENKISTHTKNANTQGKKSKAHIQVYSKHILNIAPNSKRQLTSPARKKPSRPEATGTGTTQALPVSTLCQWSCTTNIDRSSAFYRH
jgi:hypothetical protein